MNAGRVHSSKIRVRRYRYAPRRPRRNPLWLATGGAIGVAIACAISLASVSGVNIAEAAVAKGKSLIELMNQRSPGKRTAAMLIKTKGKHKYYRVLSEQPDQEMAPPFEQALVDVAAPPPEKLFAPWPQLPDFFVPETPPLIPPIIPPCCTIIVPPGPPSPPGVPEPATWFTMIFGFGFLGLQLRRRRRAAPVPAMGKRECA